MKIITACIDQERGRYIAFLADDPTVKAQSGFSQAEAVGLLIQLGAVQGIEVTSVTD